MIQTQEKNNYRRFQAKLRKELYCQIIHSDFMTKQIKGIVGIEKNENRN